MGGPISSASIKQGQPVSQPSHYQNQPAKARRLFTSSFPGQTGPPGGSPPEMLAIPADDEPPGALHIEQTNKSKSYDQVDSRKEPKLQKEERVKVMI